MNIADIKELTATGALIFLAIFGAVKLNKTLGDLAGIISKLTGVIEKCSK